MRAAAERRRAVFLDRDGVIIEEVGYLRRKEDMRLLPGSARAIQRLKSSGFKVVVVSNQSAVARGYLTRKELESIHRRLRRSLADRGARLDAIYYCPHHPAAGVKRRCRCRKPGTGMLLRAARRFNLALNDCFLIGDSTTDIRTARNAGCCAVLVRTGLKGKDGRYRTRPDKVCRDLAEAAAWVLKVARRP